SRGYVPDPAPAPCTPRGFAGGVLSPCLLCSVTLRGVLSRTLSELRAKFGCCSPELRRNRDIRARAACLADITCSRLSFHWRKSWTLTPVSLISHRPDVSSSARRFGE